MASSSKTTKTTEPSQPPKKRRKHSHHQISNPPPSKKPVNPYPRIGTPYATNELPALPCYELTPIMEEYMETLKEFSSGCPKMNVLDPSSAFFTEWRHMLEFEEEDAGEVVEQVAPASTDIDVWQYINTLADAEVLA